MKEYIIKIGDEPDIMGNYGLKEKPKELIRCKDCKWHDNADDSPKYLPCMEMRTNPNWFCADGEHA